MQKMIKLSDTCYVIVDDSEIKEGDCYIGWETNYATKPKEKWVIYYKSSGCNGNLHYKITHSTFMLDGVQTIPLSKVEEAINGYSIDELFLKWESENYNCYNSEDSAFEAGFKAHQELVKDKLFTVEDMRRELQSLATEIATEDGELASCSPSLIFSWIENKIESLLPKTEWNIQFDEQGKIKLL